MDIDEDQEFEEFCQIQTQIMMQAITKHPRFQDFSIEEKQGFISDVTLAFYENLNVEFYEEICDNAHKIFEEYELTNQTSKMLYRLALKERLKNGKVK